MRSDQLGRSSVQSCSEGVKETFVFAFFFFIALSGIFPSMDPSNKISAFMEPPAWSHLETSNSLFALLLLRCAAPVGKESSHPNDKCMDSETLCSRLRFRANGVEIESIVMSRSVFCLWNMLRFKRQMQGHASSNSWWSPYGFGFVRH